MATRRADAPACETRRERLTWNDICARHPDEWVVLVDLVWDNGDEENGELLSAVVLGHSKKRVDSMRETKPIRQISCLLGQDLAVEEVLIIEPRVGPKDVKLALASVEPEILADKRGVGIAVGIGSANGGVPRLIGDRRESPSYPLIEGGGHEDGNPGLVPGDRGL